MWENHRVVLPPHSYFSYLPYTSSHLQSRSPALLTSLVKGDTAERIKSNQWTLGTLHEHPYACVAATISPIIGWFTSLILFFFPPPPSHSSVTLMHLGMFHAAADDFWFEGGSARIDGDWLSVAEWRSITQIISGAGNVSTQAERGWGGTWPWAVSCVWHLVSQPRQGLIIFISSPLTVGTVVHSVSEKKKINHNK